MKKLAVSILLSAIFISRSWAGDEPPTIESNKHLIDKTIGLRVSAEEEMEGLDFVEHGGNAYPEFEVASYGGVGPAMGPGAASASADLVGQFKPAEQT